jgi:hypothetical protein
VVEASALSLAPIGSFSKLSTEATFRIVPALVGRTPIVTITALAPVGSAARFPTEHVTLEPLWLHVPLLVVAAMKSAWLGSRSVTTTPVAPWGPRLMTRTV